MAAAKTVFARTRLVGTAAAAGGTFTADYACPTDRAIHVRARVYMTAQTGAPAHLTHTSVFRAEYTIRNNNGAMVTPTVLGGSTNPLNSGTAGNASSHAEVDEFGGGSPSSANFTTSGTNARLTVTNNHATQAADVVVIFEVDVVG